MEMFTRMVLECFFWQHSSIRNNYLVTLFRVLYNNARQTGNSSTRFALSLSLSPAVFVGRLFEKTEKKMADKHVLRVWYFEYANDGVVYTFERPFGDGSSSVQQFDSRNETLFTEIPSLA